MTTDCTFFNLKTGEITYTAILSDETFEQHVTEGAHALLDVLGDKETQYVVDGSLVDFTPEELAAKRAMPKGWAWKMPERVAVDMRTLDEVRATKNAAINAARLAANRSSFAFGGKQIACDELSALDIAAMNGIVSLTGAMPPNWLGQWKAMDNTYVPIPDRATWISFYAAMVQAGTANFSHAQSLKAALAAATTNAEVDSITWE